MLDKPRDASISYSDALNIIEAEASKLLSSSANIEELVPLSLSINRISNRNYASAESTPKSDTSAMDGYALTSEVSAAASLENPVRFRIIGTIAAGDPPIEVDGKPNEKIYPCVEIMTGARFPKCVSGREFDCCVKVEDTRMEPGGKIIQVVKPARKDMNRRFAGNDFQEGDSILDVGDRIKINHLMALASIGVAKIAVRRRPRIAAFSTGKELLDNSTQDGAQRIMDINGPCITATLMDWGCDVDFLGVIDDNASAVSGKLMRRLQLQNYDLVITTGGVSAGKFDFVRKAIESIGAKVLFHGAAIRPGHPALFATLPAGRYGNTHVGDNRSNNEQTSTAFFGLPGNPVASASCLRFLVVPFLRQFLSEQSETPVKAIIRDERIHAKAEETYDMRETRATIARFPPSTDIFRTGRFIGWQNDSFHVEIIRDHNPGKLKPFLHADCWVHVPRGHTELTNGDILDIYPICKKENRVATFLSG